MHRIPSLRLFILLLIAVTGAPDSTLGRAATVALDANVAEEACPHDLAPTASTTVAPCFRASRRRPFATVAASSGFRLAANSSATHTGLPESQSLATANRYR